MGRIAMLKKSIFALGSVALSLLCVHAFWLQRSKDFVTNSVSLVVPMSTADIVYLPRLLESVAAQTEPPLETLIVLTSFNNTTLNEDVDLQQIRLDTLAQTILTERPRGKTPTWLTPVLRYIMSAKPPQWNDIPVRIVRTTFPHAGQARNVGAAQARGSIISFYDADDFMHPRRIETIKTAFAKSPGADMVLHRYKFLTLSSSCASNLAKFRRSKISRMNFEMFDPAIVRQNLGSSNPFTSSRRVRFGVEIRISSSKVTNFNIGAISVRKEVTSQIRQPDLQRRQDASFLWEALNQGKTLLAIPAELSAYTKPMSSKRRDVLAPMLDSSIIQTK